MNGKIAILAIFFSAVIMGGAVYYLQVYGYYRTVEPIPGADVQMAMQDGTGPAPIAYGDFQAIDADSSPIRYRACFTTPLTLEKLQQERVVAPGMEPRNGPGWFDCFDAAAIGAELDAGTAVTFMGQKNVAYGVDRIVAITQDGRGYVWHDLNDCGAKAYDGTVVGEECPPPPGSGGS